MVEYKVVMQAEWASGMGLLEGMNAESVRAHLEEYLNQMALEGWRLASSYDHLYLILERQKESV